MTFLKMTVGLHVIRWDSLLWSEVAPSLTQVTQVPSSTRLGVRRVRASDSKQSSTDWALTCATHLTGRCDNPVRKAFSPLMQWASYVSAAVTKCHSQS